MGSEGLGEKSLVQGWCNLGRRSRLGAGVASGLLEPSPSVPPLDLRVVQPVA